MDPQDINEEHGGEMVYNDQAVLQKQVFLVNFLF